LRRISSITNGEPRHKVGRKSSTLYYRTATLCASMLKSTVTTQVLWKMSAHNGIVRGAMNVVQDFLIDGGGYVHDLEEFALSGYCDAMCPCAP